MPKRVQHHRVRLSATVPPEVLARVEAEAEADGRTVSGWVTRAFQQMFAERDADLPASHTMYFNAGEKAR
jgi:hypothetical protein